jgi:phage major head subunit gpT-like protein
MKTEGSGISYDEMRQGFTTRYTHATYALGFQITREAYEDGLAVVQSMRKAQALAFSMRQTKETLAALVLNRAFTAAYAGGDGKELCATDHPNVAGGTWSNELAVAADLSEAALEQMCIQVAAFTNDRGMKIAIRPQKLLIPPALEFEAARILKSVNQAGTTNNDINAIRAMGKFPGGVIVNHYLTDDDAFFVLTDCPDGMKYFERRADSFAEDNDWETEVAKFKSVFRGSWGWTDPRSVIGSTGV